MVFKNTFKHGFHIQGKKELSRGDKYIEIPAPYIVKIPLLQHIGTPSEPVVKVGDYVKVGQLIAKKVGTISANIHSSVSGKVSKIEYSTATRGNHVKCIFIENDYKNELGYELMNRDYTRLSSEEIIKIVEDAGITGLGGASFPTHIKLNPPTSVQDVIINSAECEPYLTSDDVNMRNFAKDIVIGLKIEMHALNAQNGHILIEDDKPEAIKAIKEAVKDESNIRVVVAKAKYPQGDEKRVIDVTLGKVVPFGKHPFDVGVIVSLLKSLIDEKFEILILMVIVATLSTIAEMTIKFIYPLTFESMGIFTSLISVNSIILIRLQKNAMISGVVSSLIDSITTGLGYTLVIVVLALIRELIGNVTIYGLRFISREFTIKTFNEPMMGFILLALFIALSNWYTISKKLREARK